MPEHLKSFTKHLKKKPFELMMEYAYNDPLLTDLVAYNELKHTYQFLKDFENIRTGDYFRDEHIAILKWYFVRIWDIQLSENMILQLLQLEGSKHIINPIKDWLKDLKWDGFHRIDSWLHLYTGCELNQYTSKVGIILLCGAVNRIMNPGSKFDYMVILEGEQGIMKSTLFEVLGGDYYISLSFGHHEKEIVENIQGAWFIEIADMNGFKKQEIEWLRAFLTRKADRCRLPYARASQDFNRQNIFVATTNPSGDNEYLKDDTGNRRFLPILCGKMNINGLRDMRDQLFAEAYIRYKDEVLYLTGEAETIAKQEQYNREEADIWFQPIRTWVELKPITKTADILSNCLHIDINKASQYDKVRIGKVMKKLKWGRKQNSFGEWEYHQPTNGKLEPSAGIPQIVQVSNDQQTDIDWSE